MAEVPGFFGTLTPYVMIAVLIAAANVMCFFRDKEGKYPKLKFSLAVAIPVCLGSAALLEILAFVFVKTDAIWWCDADRVGFWKGTLYLIPLLVFVVLQFLSFSAYNRFMFEDNPALSTKAGADESICIKPAVYGLVLFVPLTVLLLWLSIAMGWKDKTTVNLMLCIPIAILVIGLGICIYKNIKIFGTGAGLIIPFFCVVYILGDIAAVIFCAIAIWKVILQLLAAGGALCLLATGISKTGILEQMEKDAKKEEERQRKNREHYGY